MRVQVSCPAPKFDCVAEFGIRRCGQAYMDTLYREVTRSYSWQKLVDIASMTDYVIAGSTPATIINMAL